jgi:hypothetical protein
MRRLSWNTKVPYRVQRNLPLVPILCQMNPVNIFHYAESLLQESEVTQPRNSHLLRTQMFITMFKKITVLQYPETKNHFRYLHGADSLTRSFLRSSPHFMKHEISLIFSHDSATGLYPEPMKPEN